MTEVSYELPEIGEVSSAADPRTLNALVALKAWVNGTGNVSESQLAAAVISKLNAKATGLESQKSIIATEETRENTAYGALTTPDEVTVSLAENGLIVVGYQALWKESVASAARAALFIGATQLTIQAFNEAVGRKPQTQGAQTSSAIANNFAPVFSTTVGLASIAAGGPYSADLTTGQVVGFVDQAEHDTTNMEIGGNGVTVGGTHGGLGGPCYIFAAAGTYKISIQFRSSSGKVTAKQRKLWAWTIS